MTDIQKIIDGLQRVYMYMRNELEYAVSTDGMENIVEMRDAASDAVRLLKAQEPRLLTMDDLEAYIVSNSGCEIPVWTEFRDEAGHTLIHADIVCGANRKRICFAQYYEHGARANEWIDYNITWRCWTIKPTEEQRRAVPWL